MYTRPVAFILSGEMAAAYFIEHFPVSFFPILNEGDLAVSLCFALLYLSFAGGGPWSLDALSDRKKAAAVTAPDPAEITKTAPRETGF